MLGMCPGSPCRLISESPSQEAQRSPADAKDRTRRFDTCITNAAHFIHIIRTLLLANIKNTKQPETPVQQPHRVSHEQLLSIHPEDGDKDGRGRVRAPEDGENGEDVAYWVTRETRRVSTKR